MDKFEVQEIKKTSSIKKNWYDRLIKQTMAREMKPKLIRDKFKDKISRDIIWALFETEKEKEERKKKEA